METETSLKPKYSTPFEGAVWMVSITLLLILFPVINGFIGGFVGGYRVGRVKQAMLAALLPAIVISVATWVLFTVLTLPVIGIFAGFGAGMLVLFADLSIFVGALIGAGMRD
jgi:hypothetical protein